MNGLDRHAKLKGIHRRGSVVQSHMSALRYLRELEAEHAMIGELLRDAWRGIDAAADWRDFLRKSDPAQQRLHRALRKLARWPSLR